MGKERITDNLQSFADSHALYFIQTITLSSLVSLISKCGRSVKFASKGFSKGYFPINLIEGIFYWRNITKGLSKVDVMQTWTAE